MIPLESGAYSKCGEVFYTGICSCLLGKAVWSVVVLWAAVWRRRRFRRSPWQLWPTKGGGSGLGLALILESQAAQRDLGSGPEAEACWDSLGGVLAFQGLGNPLRPGGGRRCSRIGSGSTAASALSNSSSKQQPRLQPQQQAPPTRPGSQHGARDGDAGVAPSAPGAAGGRGDLGGGWMTFTQSSPWI